VGGDGDGLKLSSGNDHSAGVCGISAENNGPAMGVLKVDSGRSGGAILCGVLNVMRAGGTCAALSFSSGALRATNNAFFNFCADLSAFKAAAVVTAI